MVQGSPPSPVQELGLSLLPGAVVPVPARVLWEAIVANESARHGLISDAPLTGDRQAVMASAFADESASVEAIASVGESSESREVAAADEVSKPANQEAAERASAAGQAEREQVSAAEKPGGGPAGLGFDQRPITSLTVNIAAKAGELPNNLGRDSLARIEMKRPEAVLLRHWPLLSCEWEAPALAYRPLYFEEVNLERHGYGLKYLRAAQPIISAGQFFTTVPILPYKMLAEPARTPVYTLGHDRPGSNVPYRPVLPPLSISGSAVEAGVAAGLIFAIP